MLFNGLSLEFIIDLFNFFSNLPQIYLIELMDVSANTNC